MSTNDAVSREAVKDVIDKFLFIGSKRAVWDDLMGAIDQLPPLQSDGPGRSYDAMDYRQMYLDLIGAIRRVLDIHGEAAEIVQKAANKILAQAEQEEKTDDNTTR